MAKNLRDVLYEYKNSTYTLRIEVDELDFHVFISVKGRPEMYYVLKRQLYADNPSLLVATVTQILSEMLKSKGNMIKEIPNPSFKREV